MNDDPILTNEQAHEAAEKIRRGYAEYDDGTELVLSYANEGLDALLASHAELARQLDEFKRAAAEHAPWMVDENEPAAPQR